jgi:hypothetical protein
LADVVGFPDGRTPKMAADPNTRPTAAMVVAMTSARCIAAFRISSSAFGEG